MAAVEAPVSRYKKQNLLIWIAVLAGLAVWFAYDGYMNEKFIEKHTKEGRPDHTLIFNRVSPPFLLAGSIVLAGWLMMIRNRKLTATDDSLHTGKAEIPYNRIESIDKTHFDSKGFFTLSYEENGQKREVKFSDRMYDNLPAVLDRIVEKIS